MKSCRRAWNVATRRNPGKLPLVNPFVQMGLVPSDRETPTATFDELTAFRTKAVEMGYGDANRLLCTCELLKQRRFVEQNAAAMLPFIDQRLRRIIHGNPAEPPTFTHGKVSECGAPQMRAAFSSIDSNTGLSLPGELEIVRSTSGIACTSSLAPLGSLLLHVSLGARPNATVLPCYCAFSADDRHPNWAVGRSRGFLSTRLDGASGAQLASVDVAENSSRVTLVIDFGPGAPPPGSFFFDGAWPLAAHPDRSRFTLLPTRPSRSTARHITLPLYSLQRMTGTLIWSSSVSGVRRETGKE
jgi:hypothetical protein